MIISMTRWQTVKIRLRLICSSLSNHVKYRTTSVPGSGTYKTHYEILGLSSDCSTKQIKNAYVQLCKEFHPDRKPGDAAQHKKFVELNNAYTVLVRPESRQLYDYNLSLSSHSQNRSYDQARYEKHTASQKPFERNSWRDETIWSMRNKSQDKFYENGSYYGIKGLERISNAWIVGGCTVLILIGAILHYVAFRFGTTFSHKRLDEISSRNSKIYSEAKEKALENGNEKQTERLKDLWNLSDSYYNRKV